MKYRRDPSVSVGAIFKVPSLVIWVEPTTRAGGTGHRSQTTNTPARIARLQDSTVHRDLNRWAVGTSLCVVLAMFGPTGASAFPDSVSRFSRLRSARSSAADWQRISRSFSNALLMIRSSSAARRDSAAQELQALDSRWIRRSTP